MTQVSVPTISVVQQTSAAEEREKISRNAAVAALRENSKLGETIAPGYIIWVFARHALAEAKQLKQIQAAGILLAAGSACVLCKFIISLINNIYIVVCLSLLVGVWAYFTWRKFGTSFTWRQLVHSIQMKCYAMTPDEAYVVNIVLINLPTALEIFGQLNVLRFIHERSALSTVVFVASTPIATTLCMLPDTFPDSWKGMRRMKQFKFSVQLVTLCFWLVWSRLDDPMDFLRLFGPVAINMAGIALATLPESTVSNILQTSLQDTLVDVVTDVEATFREDTGLMLIILKWLSDYWQLPCDFDWSDTIASLREGIASLGCSFGKKLTRRLDNLDLDDKAEPLLRTVHSYVNALPPTRRLAAAMLIVRTCPSTFAFMILLATRFVFVLPAAGFIVMELNELRRMLFLLQGALRMDLDRGCIPQETGGEEFQPPQKMQRVENDSCNHEQRPALLRSSWFKLIAGKSPLKFDSSMDGLDVLLVNSNELRSVWTKLRYALQCLERSLTVARVCHAGAKTVSLASRVTSIVMMVKTMREEGRQNPAVMRWLVQEQRALMQVCGLNKVPAGGNAGDEVIDQSDVVGSIRDAGAIIANITRLTGLWQQRLHTDNVADSDANTKTQDDSVDVGSTESAASGSWSGQSVVAAASWVSGVASRWLPASKPESEMTEEEKAEAAEKAARREKWRQSRRRLHGR
eukprot:TRINITY_DN22023_c0_g2_i1.p1 TRINITY_DN22023_c0_g2~~TRINITY_DN22023_c0_g2_i1.p1  ORF type:complete len:691 (+),score=81.67 TRINITY_DN22023_c0_g2_i1:97-2169(+)